MSRSIKTLEEIFKEPISVLMLPPRNEDWTKHAIEVSKQLPNSQVFYGIRNANYSKQRPSQELLENSVKAHSYLNNFLLTYHNKQLVSKENSNKVIPFNLTSYSNLPFKENTFDLAITQTSQGSDVMLYLWYGIEQKPKGLFDVIKPNAYWLHMTSSVSLEDTSLPYFTQLSKSSPENVENPLLRSIFGKNGWRLTLDEKQRINANETLGEIITGDNSWMLYRRREEEKRFINEK